MEKVNFVMSDLNGSPPAVYPLVELELLPWFWVANARSATSVALPLLENENLSIILPTDGLGSPPVV